MIRRRESIRLRLTNHCGYCDVCALDTVEYALSRLRGEEPFRIVRNDIEWRWNLTPDLPQRN